MRRSPSDPQGRYVAGLSSLPATDLASAERVLARLGSELRAGGAVPG